MRKSLLILTAIAGLTFSAIAGDKGITKGDDYMFTLTEQDLLTLVRICVDRDAKAIDEMVNEKRAFFLKAGIPVYIEKEDAGLIQIRPEGSTVTFWTVEEAVEIK